MFFLPGGSKVSLGEWSQQTYQYFVGDLWDRYGESAWMGPWKQVLASTGPMSQGIEQALRDLSDTDARQSAGLLLEDRENAADARAALQSVFDSPSIAELQVYNLGDGGAMSGLLLAARRQDESMVAVILLMD